MLGVYPAYKIYPFRVLALIFGVLVQRPLWAVPSPKASRRQVEGKTRQGSYSVLGGVPGIIGQDSPKAGKVLKMTF